VRPESSLRLPGDAQVRLYKRLIRSRLGLIPICIQMVAQVFNLCMRRLKPAATKNYLMIATCSKMQKNRLTLRGFLIFYQP
jgi:hypothetical protein